MTPKKKSGMGIIVNGREKRVDIATLRGSQLVVLAFEPALAPAGEFIAFSITYRNGPEQNIKGMLTEDGSVRVGPNMVFNVTTTDKS